MNKILTKVIKMNKLLKKIRSNRGNSLAEFAVTAAMMATLASTAAPRFSGVAETGKQNQTMDNLEKIAEMANQFYQDKNLLCLITTLWVKVRGVFLVKRDMKLRLVVTIDLRI